MRQRVDEMPVAMDQSGLKLLTPGSWGGMVVEYFECADRFDFATILSGLPDDMCPCPHWGYMLKGACHMEYGDGSEEVIRQGEAYYMPGTHTGWVEPGSAMLVFSPEAEAKVVQEHIARSMGD